MEPGNNEGCVQPRCFSREVKDVFKHEIIPKEPEKIEFELKEYELDSTTEEDLEEEEPQTPALRRSVRERRQPKRYSPYAFCSSFSLTITDDDPRTIRERVDLEDGKLWKEPWLMKWHPCIKMRHGIWWSCRLEGSPSGANGCLRRR